MFLDFKKWVKIIQFADYDGARTVGHFKEQAKIITKYPRKFVSFNLFLT